MRSALRNLLASLLAVAAHGCSGYLDGSSRVSSDAAINPPAPPSDQPAMSLDAFVPTPTADAGPSAPPAEPPPAEAGTTAADASSPAADAGADANLLLANSPRFAGYLSDSLGRPLYMFAGDVAGAPRTACLADCAKAWPPFDVEVAVPSSALDPADFSRFHRQDGAWQIAFKGHPLYHRASEDEGSAAVTGDAAEGRWFVARDYLVFLATAEAFTPLAGSAINDTFLTDAVGRTLYVCLDDEPSADTSEAVSSCVADCTLSRPIVTTDVAGADAVLPSVLDSSAFAMSLRPDGLRQLTYRGWPLYYFSGDVAAGATEGHNEGAWRAIEPTSFGIASELIFLD